LPTDHAIRRSWSRFARRDHQELAADYRDGVTTQPTTRLRLTQYAHGGGCACKIPPGELESLVRGLVPPTASGDLLVGLDTGDDAAVVRVSDGTAIVATADFFPPVVDDPYDFGRIAAANAFSDVYAMGGRPVVALNLVGWPRDVLPADVIADILRGGAEVARIAGCHLAGTASTIRSRSTGSP
jgi:selenide,water dikinase